MSSSTPICILRQHAFSLTSILSEYTLFSTIAGHDVNNSARANNSGSIQEDNFETAPSRLTSDRQKAR